MDILNHWRYFLSLEKEFCETLRYVEFDDKQENVYSFEYARLLILICSELDVVFKIISENINSETKPDSIGEYYETISKKYKVNSELVKIDRFSRNIKPFENWSNAEPPAWWTAHNKVKHSRHQFFEKANLINTLSATCGLFLANVIALQELNQLESLEEWPILLDREHKASNTIILKTSYEGVQLVAPNKSF